MYFLIIFLFELKYTTISWPISHSYRWIRYYYYYCYYYYLSDKASHTFSFSSPQGSANYWRKATFREQRGGAEETQHQINPAARSHISQAAFGSLEVRHNACMLLFNSCQAMLFFKMPMKYQSDALQRVKYPSGIREAVAPWQQTCPWLKLMQSQPPLPLKWRHKKRTMTSPQSWKL